MEFWRSKIPTWGCSFSQRFVFNKTFFWKGGGVVSKQSYFLTQASFFSGNLGTGSQAVLIRVRLALSAILVHLDIDKSKILLKLNTF